MKYIFRGQTEDGRWVEGSYLRKYIKPSKTYVSYGHYIYITDDEEYLVTHESVGQYTGLKDKNGKRIFEGDILKDGLDGLNQVLWGIRNSKPCFYIQGIDRAKYEWPFIDNLDSLEVIYNLTDNPELLQE